MTRGCGAHVDGIRTTSAVRTSSVNAVAAGNIDAGTMLFPGLRLFAVRPPRVASAWQRRRHDVVTVISVTTTASVVVVCRRRRRRWRKRTTRSGRRSPRRVKRGGRRSRFSRWNGRRRRTTPRGGGRSGGRVDAVVPFGCGSASALSNVIAFHQVFVFFSVD